MLIKDAIEHNRRAYVLVNNRLEGNAPLTVQALTDLLKAEILIGAAIPPFPLPDAERAICFRLPVFVSLHPD